MIDTLSPYLQWEVLGNSGTDYAIALITILGLLLILRVIERVIISHLERLAKKTSTDIDDFVIDMIRALRPPFFVSLSVYFGLKSLTLPASIDTGINYTIMLVVIYYVLRVLQRIVDYAVKKHNDRVDSLHQDATAELLGNILKVALWLFAGIFVLSNLGYNISSLITGLGIGGIAVALAVQNILSDMFSSFSIYFDKPFQVGDYIVLGDKSGTVKKIGLKSTRIQALQGEEIVVSNAELTNAQIQNYKKMERRRIVFSVGVAYETPLTKLKKIPEILKDIFEPIPNAELDRVHFKAFADSSLTFEIVYYMHDSAYMAYMDTQQEVNLAIVKAFQQAKIEFAYPTRTVYTKKA